MNIQLECLYCGFIWEKQVWNQSNVENLKCERRGCNDSNLKVRDLTKTKVDYYKGCPPFPTKKKEYGYGDLE